VCFVRKCISQKTGIANGCSISLKIVRKPFVTKPSDFDIIVSVVKPSKNITPIINTKLNNVLLIMKLDALNP